MAYGTFTPRASTGLDICRGVSLSLTLTFPVSPWPKDDSRGRRTRLYGALANSRLPYSFDQSQATFFSSLLWPQDCFWVTINFYLETEICL